jgi:hypothetical protein
MTIQLAHTENRSHARRGFSDDPVFKTRSKVRLLHGVSTMPRHGLGAPGLYCLPNEGQTCTSKLRVISGALHTVFVERAAKDKWVGDHYVLPDNAEKEGYRWRLPNGNAIEKEARLAATFNGVEAEFDLAKTAMKMARAFHADARAHADKFDCSLCALAYEFGVQELTNDRGQTYYSPTFTFIGAAGEPEGPSETEVLRASALCDMVEAAIAAEKREAEDRRSAILPPRSIAPRPLITSGATALRAVEAPPPVESYHGPGIDDDIPF